MRSQTDIQRMLTSLSGERDGVFIYQKLAQYEKDARLAEVFRRMAAAEEKHAKIWEERIKQMGGQVLPYRPGWRAKILVWAARRFGAASVLPTLSGMENAGRHAYQQQVGTEADIDSMAADESSHARLLGHIRRSAPGGMEGGVLAQMEGRHKASGGNALRAAVLGANDGLVSNLSLVMGVAGAELSGSAILITGLAGLLAGAFSMALGEWLSVQSSRELYQHQLEIEREEIAHAPDEEAEELALIYQARGLNEGQARQLARQIMSDSTSALETKAREELSIDPEELGGSAWEAALTSFVLFALGAIIPVLPFIFLQGTLAMIGSLLLSTVGLFLIGGGITLFTGRSVIYSGVRQVIFGLVAAAITFLIGRLIGVNLGG